MHMGFIDYLNAATGLLNAGKGGGGGAPGVMVSTATNVNTQVSPQISPVFVQQSDPSNSPVNAGIGMGTPVTGAMPGFDNLPVPVQRAAVNPLVVGGVILAAVAAFALSKKRGA